MIEWKLNKVGGKHGGLARCRQVDARRLLVKEELTGVQLPPGVYFDWRTFLSFMYFGELLEAALVLQGLLPDMGTHSLFLNEE